MLPATILIFSEVPFAAGQNRFGPMFAASPLGRIIGGVFVLAISALSIMCFLGSPSYVPFNSKAITSCLLLPAMLLVLLAGEIGGTPDKHPDVPHSTFKLPIFRATSEAVRGLNTVSDFSVAQSMFLKVRRSCVLPRLVMLTHESACALDFISCFSTRTCAINCR